MAVNPPDDGPGTNPDDVARKTFSSVRKGYDPIEVQGYLVSVSAELRDARARLLELEEDLRAARQEADRNREVDPARLTALLGEETTRVLDVAREAADSTRARAEEESSRKLSDAQTEADRLRQEAEEVLARRAAEAEVEVGAIMARADELKARAEAEAAAEVEEGRRQGREMVAEAQKVRERMLNDLARRRKLFRQQIERLQAGRDRLLSAYDVVRETLDAATEELHVALPEARLAAEAAALRAADEGEASAEQLEREAASLPEAEPAATMTAAPADDAAADGSAADEAEGADGDDGDELTAEEEGEAAATAAGPTEAEESDATGPAETEGGADGEGDDDADRPVTADSSDVDEGRRSSSVKVIRSGDQGVSGLFARIREETTDDAVDDDAEAPETAAGATPKLAVVEAIEEVEVETTVIETEAGEVEVIETEVIETEVITVELVEEVIVDEDDATAGEPAAPLDPDQALKAQRDAALDELARSLTRRVKRELSDEQNELLDTVRRQKGRPAADAVLPALDAHLVRYREAAGPSLRAAAEAGSDLVAPTGGSSAPAATDDLAAQLADEVVGPLRDRLERCFVEAVDDPDELAERIRACYREWKGQRVDAVAAPALVAAANRGILAGLADGTLVHWVVDDGDTPSPDCDDNALAGDISKGEAFPTGHTAPPISPHCRCLVAPKVG